VVVPKREQDATLSELAPLMSWRGLIVDTDLPARTKLVALVLSLYVSECGDSEWPDVLELAKDASLSPEAVALELAILRRRGWLDDDERLIMEALGW
jgi:hypothetical protein